MRKDGLSKLKSIDTFFFKGGENVSVTKISPPLFPMNGAPQLIISLFRLNAGRSGLFNLWLRALWRRKCFRTVNVIVTGRRVRRRREILQFLIRLLNRIRSSGKERALASSLPPPIQKQMAMRFAFPPQCQNSWGQSNKVAFREVTLFDQWMLGFIWNISY